MTQTWVLLTSTFLHWKSAIFVIILLTLFQSLKIVLINMVAILMMSAKLSTLDSLKRRVFLNKDYDIIISVHDVMNKILSRESNYIVDVVMWPKFSNSSISMRKVVITLTRETFFFEECSWFKFSNLQLALDMALKFNASVTKRLKLKVLKILGLIPAFVEKTGKKLVGGFLPPILNRVKYAC